MKKFFLTIFLWIFFLGFSQGENDNWYFGHNAGVNFSGISPIALTDGQIFTDEATGVVSDSNGHLLFYTDGGKVWDREHNIMVNGTGLLGNYSSQQLAIAQNPANAMQYYIFTAGVNDSSANTFIAYTIVDLSMGSLGTNGYPLGIVLANQKNIPILDNLGHNILSEAVTLVMHQDGDSFWLLIPSGANLLTYRVSSQGIQTIPFVSNLNIPTNLDDPIHFGVKASPRVSYSTGFSNYVSVNVWLPSVNYGNYVRSFDNNTGLLTNNFSLNVNADISYAAEFDINAKIMYLARSNVYAINLPASTTSVVINQIYTGTTGVNFYGIQRNKHNDIYLSEYNYDYLSKIINPNTFGSSSVNIDEIFLNGKTARLGLPQETLYTSAQATECVTTYLLNDPESNVNHSYSASEFIITNDDYIVGASNGVIMMKAEKYINLLPNTYIKSGSDFLAKIEDCEVFGKKIMKEQESPKKISLSIDLDNMMSPQNINVYPNPATSIVHIELRNELLLKWEFYDMSGKIVKEGKTREINIENLLSGSYLLLIKTDKQKMTKKIIKK